MNDLLEVFSKNVANGKLENSNLLTIEKIPLSGIQEGLVSTTQTQ